MRQYERNTCLNILNMFLFNFNMGLKGGNEWN